MLQQQLGMSWVTGCNGEELLLHEGPSNRICIWPVARVLEVQEGSVPQFGRYAWLLDHALRYCLRFDNLSDEPARWARHVVETWERKGAPWS